jgi:hypothetical protein
VGRRRPARRRPRPLHTPSTTHHRSVARPPARRRPGRRRGAWGRPWRTESWPP